MTGRPPGQTGAVEPLLNGVFAARAAASRRPGRARCRIRFDPGQRDESCGRQAGHTPYMGDGGPGTGALLLAKRHRKKGLLTVEVPVVPRSGIRQAAQAPLPRTSREGLAAAVRNVAHGAVAAGLQGPCPCRGQPVSRGQVPCGGATAQHATSRHATRPPANRNRDGAARAVAPSTGRGSCYDRASRSNPIAFAT
jgi:hypothetical protein